MGYGMIIFVLTGWYSYITLLCFLRTMFPEASTGKKSHLLISFIHLLNSASPLKGLSFVNIKSESKLD